MKKIAEMIIKLRIVIIISVVIITAVLGYYLKNIKINSDILSYLPKGDPIVKLFNYIGDEYGGNQLALIALETDDVFKKETIETVNKLTQEFKKIKNVSYVTSLTNVLDIKTDEEGTLQISKLIDEYNLPTEIEELEEIKNYTLSKDMYRGYLISEDAKGTLIICRFSDEADKVKAASQLKEIVNKADINEKVYYGGLPFQLTEISEIIQKDLQKLIPFILLLIIIALYISYRSIRGVIIPILSVSISTVWTLGVMSLLEVPLTAISDIIPVVLIAVGSAYSIHVVSKFNEEVTSNSNRLEQSKKALSEIMLPVLMAGVTTIAGFISFIFGSYLTMIAEFGWFTSLGIFFALLVAITFVPSVLSLLPVRIIPLIDEVSPKKSGMSKFMDKIGGWILKNEKTIVTFAVLIAIVSFIGIPKIERKVDLLDYFKQDTSIRITEEMMERRFGGSVPVQFLVQGDIQDPEVLNKMKKIEDFLEKQDGVHNPKSVADLIEEMSDAMGEGKSIPESKEMVGNLWFLLEGEEVMNQLVNAEKTEAVIQATITNVNTQFVKDLVEKIEYFLLPLNNERFHVSQTGLTSIYLRLDETITGSQVQSLIIAIILVFICLLVLMKSVSGAIIGLSSIGLSLIIIFGFMGFSGIPLDIATVLVGSISIGIGIDYSIHFISRFRSDFNKSGIEIDSLDSTLETTGEAIMINVVTVMMGFLVLLFADLVPLQRFGLLVAITMIVSGITAITLLPALILLNKTGFIEKFNELKFKSKYHLKRKK
jgi:hydrophobe/amphiphile efflux-3 (HAE3) family protein